MTNHIEELMKAAGVSKYRYFRQYNYETSSILICRYIIEY